MRSHSFVKRLAVLAGLSFVCCKPPPAPAVVHPDPAVVDPREAEPPTPPPVAAGERDLYAEAREVLEARCVVCHGCYDAPCQLKLDEPGGIQRGASKIPVYAGSRLTAKTPTRFGIDAQSIDEWRKLDFHPVVETDATGAATSGSILRRLLALKREHPLPEGKLLPDDMPVDIQREAVCAAPDEMDDYVEDHPTWGMPYALPSLAESEQATIERWLADGSPIPELPELPADVGAAVERWETFFNQKTKKGQLMARYLYEHLFLATLLIEGEDGSQVPFRLVRSTTPPGQPIEEMATRRPFDAPIGDTLHYRMRRWTAVRLSKTHMPYALNDARMERWRELFLEPDYRVESLPGYGDVRAANPFATFHAIPVRSRYAFMLDEAEFTLMGFIKGPVCRGQVALNVIQDHFWVTFVSPDSPLIEAEDDFLRENAAHLDLPAGAGSNANPVRWFRYSRGQRAYLEAKSRFLAGQAEKLGPPTLDIVWDGKGENPNAGLTVFRHFDSASVTKGLVGAEPKTAWLLSYSVLERIHYLLVAGFDVFGNVGHQLNTRLYMDFLRMEAEHNFLLLLPKDERRKLVDAWYQDVGKRAKDEVYGRLAASPSDTGVEYGTGNPKNELLAKLVVHLHGALAGQRPSLAQLEHADLREPLQVLASLGGLTATQFPEHTFLYVRGAPGPFSHFTVLRNSAHTNVAHVFREEARRKRERDSLTVVPGFLGAYPHALLVVDFADLKAFAARASAVDGPGAYQALLDDYGVRRTDPSFWEHSDLLREARRDLTSPEAGLLDYNRLENR